MKEISAKDLHAKIEANEEIQIIDVREEYEREICTINGDHMPMNEIMGMSENIRRDVPVVVHCRSGQRSAAVIDALETKLGFENLYNLTGGILAYAQDVDTSLELY